jgi:hypothetical protein
MGVEPMSPKFEQEKTVHASDPAAPIIGLGSILTGVFSVTTVSKSLTRVFQFT